MNGKLSEKIISDAEEKAIAAVAEAEKRAGDAVAAAENEARKIVDERVNEAIRKGKEAVRRSEINAKLECNRLMLKRKAEILDGVFDQALNMFKALPREQYARFLGALLEKYAEEGDCAVLSKACPCSDLVQALPVFADKRLTLSKETGNFCGGMLLIGKTCDKDLTFEAIITSQKEKMQAEVAARLFGE